MSEIERLIISESRFEIRHKSMFLRGIIDAKSERWFQADSIGSFVYLNGGNSNIYGNIGFLGNISNKYKRIGYIDGSDRLFLSIDAIKRVIDKYQEFVNRDCVYVIQIGNYKEYKIGIATNLKSRMSNYKVGLPSTLDVKLIFAYGVESPISVERYLHNLYSTKRTRGEWFALSNTDLSDIEKYLSTLSTLDQVTYTDKLIFLDKLLNMIGSGIYK